MKVADRITTIRLVLAPVFFALYYLPQIFPALGEALWTIPILWLIFIAAELTDFFDGWAARRRNETSDFGRLYDPFADTLTQLSFFLCFVLDGLLPAALFLLVIYREFSVLFIRNLMLRKGVAMGARIGGKIKTVSYIAACALALLASTLARLGAAESFCEATSVAARVVFFISAALSVVSFFDYLSVYRKAP